MSFQPTLTRFVFTDLKGEALLWLSLLVGLTKFDYNYNSSNFVCFRSRSILIISFMSKFSLSRSHSRLQVIELLVGDKTSEIEILRSFQFPHCPVIGLLDKGNEA